MARKNFCSGKVSMCYRRAVSGIVPFTWLIFSCRKTFWLVTTRLFSGVTCVGPNSVRDFFNLRKIGLSKWRILIINPDIWVAFDYRNSIDSRFSMSCFCVSFITGKWGKLVSVLLIILHIEFHFIVFTCKMKLGLKRCVRLTVVYSICIIARNLYHNPVQNSVPL